VRRVVGPVSWWVVLFWFWFLLVGEWDRQELVAAAIAATIGTIAAETARRVAGVSPRVGGGVLARSKGVPVAIVVDFAIVIWVLARSLARRRVVRGAFHVRRGGTEDPAWLTWLATLSPNAYVVDVDEQGGTVLVHDLVARRASERPA
jgi:multisubunit Na+/H+ antiporter MnhE subunit